MNQENTSDTMKKIYTAPQTTAIRVQTEGMMAMSSYYDQVSSKPQLSDEKAWDDADWSDVEE